MKVPASASPARSPPEAQLACLVREQELGHKQAAEQTEQDAHGQEEAPPAPGPAGPIRRQATARHDAVNVWMMRERLSPAVQNHGG